MKDTAKDKPLLPQSYSYNDIENLAKSMDKGAFGMMMDARVRQIEKYQKVTFVELGLICLKVEQTEAWSYMYGGGKFRSFGAWISDAAPQSRATAYSAMGAVRQLLEDKVPLDTANRISRVNIKVVNKLSTKLKQDPEILKAAQTMEEREFKRHLEEKHPEQHIEDDSPMRFRPTKSQRHTIDTALQAIMDLQELDTREEALLSMAADWLLTHEDELREAYAEQGATIQ